MIDQKIQEAVETGIYSKKDLLDWMKHLQEIETGMKPKNTGPAVAVQINNYDKLMKDLMEWENFNNPKKSQALRATMDDSSRI